MSLRLAVVTDELVAPVCTAFEHVFGESRSPEVWRQIYRSSPDGAAGILGLDESGTVVGHYGATLQRVVSAGRDDAVFGQIRDVFTRPSVRGAGTGRSSLFARMGREFRERFGGDDLQLIFGFPSERHFRLGARLLDYRRIAGLTVWEREVTVPGNVTTGRLGALVPVARFGKDVDRLWADRPAIATLAAPRTSAFLNWRFAPRPDRNYRRYRYESFLAGGTAAYVILAQHGAEANLTDFRLPDDSDLRQDMWRQLLDLLGRSAIRRVTTMASVAVPETRCLPALGFVAATAPPPWVPACVAYTPEWRDCELGAVFHLTMADGDIF